MKYFAILVVLVMLFVNCAPVFVEAPSGRDVKLQTLTTDSGIQSSMKCWYLFWGLKPLSNNSTADLITIKNLSSIKVKVYYSFVDWIISCLTGGIVMSNTVEIQGDVK